MQSFMVTPEQSNKKIIQIITSKYPRVPLSAVHKALRQKDIKVNGARIREDVKVSVGDRIEVYIADSILCPKQALDIVYEDKNLVLINKPQGLKVHPDADVNEVSLIELLKEQYGPDIALCHRLDRNTGGLIIAGKHPKATEILVKKIQNNEITKLYQCRVHGKLPKETETLTAYLSKNARDSLVFVKDQPSAGASKIITRYTRLSYDNDTDTSVAEIQLMTGKTHQIRAHMAHIGHPVVGDGKYGSNVQKKKLGEKTKYQSLFAYKLIFSFTTPAGILDYLKNELFEITVSF